jgi:dihydrodipicolinate synthase/N-acetylneuraminate lyase
MSLEIIKSQWIENANLKAYYRFENGALTTDSSVSGGQTSEYYHLTAAEHAALLLLI